MVVLLLRGKRGCGGGVRCVLDCDVDEVGRSWYVRYQRIYACTFERIRNTVARWLQHHCWGLDLIRVGHLGYHSDEVALLRICLPRQNLFVPPVTVLRAGSPILMTTEL